MSFFVFSSPPYMVTTEHKASKNARTSPTLSVPELFSLRRLLSEAEGGRDGAGGQRSRLAGHRVWAGAEVAVWASAGERPENAGAQSEEAGAGPSDTAAGSPEEAEAAGSSTAGSSTAGSSTTWPLWPSPSPAWWSPRVW